MSDSQCAARRSGAGGHKGAGLGLSPSTERHLSRDGRQHPWHTWTLQPARRAHLQSERTLHALPMDQTRKTSNCRHVNLSLFVPSPPTRVQQAPACPSIHPQPRCRETSIPCVCVSMCARALSVLHYVSSDLQRGTEGIFSPRRLELSVKCLSSLIISIRVTGDRAFCSERTYCKNCQMEFVSRSNVSIYSGS